MKLYKQLLINTNNPEVISFIGGGGKTTSIKVLARELADLGLTVLITTTTKIFESMKNYGDQYFLGEIPSNYKPYKGSITILGDSIIDGKLIGSSTDMINEIHLRSVFDFILIEADGAKRKPIKAPNSHEPVICDCTTITIGVLGIDSIGLEINQDNVHRPELLKKILLVSESHNINYKDVVKLSLHPNGLFKNSMGKRILFVNKINSTYDLAFGKQIREDLKDSDIVIVLGDLMNKLYY